MNFPKNIYERFKFSIIGKLKYKSLKYMPVKSILKAIAWNGKWSFNWGILNSY